MFRQIKRKKYTGSNVKISNIPKRFQKSMFYKTKHLNPSDLNENTYSNLQNLLGNKETIKLLEELGNLEFVENSDNSFLLKELKRENKTKEARNNEKDLGFILKDRKNSYVKKGKRNKFIPGNNYLNKPLTSGSDWHHRIDGFVAFVNIMKGYDKTKDEKEIETKEYDMLLNNVEKNKRDVVEMIFKMVSNLPDFNDDDEVLNRYFKVIKFIIASGIDIDNLIKLRGNYKNQKTSMINDV
ncbi:hypothetical protein [Helicovermis profundi]|uniref:Uncharacterized protein n=1 Tax=Helicovermis profundi TaxID=3065157 RepID=A0AAU9ENW6_9FIRM|nr:hypothetical protein HLPR_13470 [Clostridia bacterium S502]